VIQQRISIARAPVVVRLFDPIARRLLGIGFPMGPNTLLTVRGRTSGQPRSAGVALVEIGERLWVISAFGETHWVRNLRSAQEGTIRVNGHDEPVRATELTSAEAVDFFLNVLKPHIRGMALPLRLLFSVFTREIFADPAAAAARRPVFELHRAADGQGMAQ
jgi:deazaflavin-dependent oxidoreductase (nitroreductase family)